MASSASSGADAGAGQPAASASTGAADGDSEPDMPPLCDVGEDSPNEGDSGDESEPGDWGRADGEEGEDFISLAEWNAKDIPFSVTQTDPDKPVLYMKGFSYDAHFSRIKAGYSARPTLMKKMPPPYKLPFPNDAAYGPRPVDSAPQWEHLRWECRKYIDRLYITYSHNLNKQDEFIGPDMPVRDKVENINR